VNSLVESPGEALVALGCRVTLDARGRMTGALSARVRAAAEEYVRRCDAHAVPVLVVSGGRHWAGVVEADAMASELVHLGVPAQAVVRERCSLSTRDNARFVAAVLTRRGIARATVVTCVWHLPRALAFFRAYGIEVDGIGAPPSGRTPTMRHLWQWGRERVLTWAQRPR
jgi:uncharacterized SAM-binding protein YcdF (DUF218 family)